MSISQVKKPRAPRLTPAVPQTSAAERGRLLYKLAEKIRANAAQLPSWNAQFGQAHCEAEYDIAECRNLFRYYAGLANKVLGHVIPCPRTR